MTDEENDSSIGLAKRCWLRLKEQGPRVRRVGSNLILIIRDYRSFVGYSVFPGLFAYLLAALLSNTSVFALETWDQLLSNGSLYMLSVGLAGNLMLRVMTLEDKSARDHLHVWTSMSLLASAAGFGAVAGSDPSTLGDEFTKASIFLFVITTLIVGVFTSVSVVRDGKRTLRTRTDLEQRIRELESMHEAQIIDLTDQHAQEVAQLRASMEAPGSEGH